MNEYRVNSFERHNLIESDNQLVLLLHSQIDAATKDAIGSQIQMVEAGSSAAGTALCYELNPDCVIIHTSLISKEGTDAFQEIIDLCDNNYIPVIVVTPSIEIEFYKKYAFAQIIMESPINSLTMTRELQILLAKRKRIMSQLLIDQMTGVKNQVFLEQEIEDLLNDMKRSHESFALVYIELDGMHRVRQSHGYKTSHEMMKGLAHFFKQSLRPADSVARYQQGFVLVLPKTYRDDALKMLGRLMTKFKQIKFDTPEGETTATFSAKVVDFIDSSQTARQCLSLVPFLPEEKSEDGKELLIDGGEQETGNALRKLKVGIIDDDRIIRELLRMQLSDIGEEEFEVEVRSFADGEEFFNDPWHRQNERFLLIIDRIMPKMDGLEILQKIRTQYDRRRYLCIMLTSRDSESEIALAIQKGANDYLIKPFSLKELRARINRLFRGSR
ncbi:response regulator [Paenibacillus sp. sptzw28]|uniref:response regulator n=1 Tax=Paenibacillus sp. sptzw28 TaxID=715179 RepID=UPI001C6DF1B8|nr:response regulator [Paenibacillus sp. sptzw28]QYR21883.1 response regulator [Paenibacillus sp. sptzw28]